MPPPTDILPRFLDPAGIRSVEPLGGAGGFSGSQLWRVRAAERGFCLRRWPREHPTHDRLAWIHNCLTHVANRGITFVPAPCRTHDGATFVHQAGHLWELVPWMPGTADFRENPSPARLAAAMHALARFHQAAACENPSETRWAPASAIAERLKEAERLLEGDFIRMARAIGESRPSSWQTEFAEILSLTRDRLPGLRLKLAAALQQRLPLVPAIRDIHHEHVLFTGDEVSGIVDFGAMRIDTPLADIARLVGSLACDDEPAWQVALQAYHAARPLTDDDWRLIRLLDESNVVLSGLSWLRWLYFERRDMGPAPPIKRRLHEILERLRANNNSQPG